MVRKDNACVRPVAREFHWQLGFAFLLFLLAGTAQAGGDFIAFHQNVSEGQLRVRFDLAPDLDSYYILDESTNLTQFTPRTMLYGGGTNAWSFTITLGDKPQTFWRARRVPASTPLDVDGDGIDDLYELRHGLNPLDAADASQPSGYNDFNGHPLTWLDQYRYHFQHNLNLYDAVSREVSGFNFGQPTANYEAISRETSLFNTPQPDANQNGIDDLYEFNHGLTTGSASQPSGFTTDFPNNTGTPLTWQQLYRLNFGQNRNLYDAVSREVSSFNFGQPTANYEAISREVSLFNTPSPDANQNGIDDKFELNHGLTTGSENQPSGFTTDSPNNTGKPLTWGQLYRYYFGQNKILYDTVSREVSVFNFGQPTANYEAVSREVSVYNFGQSTANYEAVSREVSIFNQP